MHNLINNCPFGGLCGSNMCTSCVLMVSAHRWLVNHMIELGFSKSLSEWIGTNLKKSGEQETWGFNLEGAVQMFHSYR